MRKEIVTLIKEQLVRDEGKKYRGYRDTRGTWTIGIGHNVESGPPLTETAVDAIFEGDLRHVCDEIARRIPWALKLDPARHAVLVNMAFNLGLGGLLKFKKMLAAMEQGNWEEAAIECADPNYVKQVGARAIRLAEQLRTGKWQ